MILLKTLDYTPIKYLIFKILEALTFFSEQTCTYIIPYENISFLYNCIEGFNNKILNFSIQIFGNLIIRIERAYEQIVQFIPLDVKIIDILISKKYENFKDVIMNTIWLIKEIMKRINEESFIDVWKNIKITAKLF